MRLLMALLWLSAAQALADVPGNVAIRPRADAWDKPVLVTCHSFGPHS